MIFPAANADASFMMTNREKLYENKEHRVDGATFSHRKMAVRPQLATHAHTIGGHINYMHKPTGKERLHHSTKKKFPLKIEIVNFLKY